MKHLQRKIDFLSLASCLFKFQVIPKQQHERSKSFRLIELI